jgi:hypothetical protein
MTEYNLNSTRRQPGRRATLLPLSDYDITQRAHDLIRRDALSPSAQAAISVLAQVGVLPEKHLFQLTGIQVRTLQKYRSSQYRFIDVVSTPSELLPFLEFLGVQGLKKNGKRLTLCTLGPVGKALAQRYEKHPLTGYLQELEEQVAHDVLCNTIYHGIAMHLGMERVRYRNRISATLRTPSGTAILEPDAMLEIKDSRGKKQVFVVEYHNEDTRRRVRAKVERYETVAREVNWADQWEIDEFPTVLVSWTHGIVATGYVEEMARMAQQRALRCTYVGMPIHLMLGTGRDPLSWKNFATHAIEPIVT